MCRKPGLDLGECPATARLYGTTHDSASHTRPRVLSRVPCSRASSLQPVNTHTHNPALLGLAFLPTDRHRPPLRVATLDVYSLRTSMASRIAGRYHAMARSNAVLLYIFLGQESNTYQPSVSPFGDSQPRCPSQ
eukprot:3674301-Prymnesium_polylepis.1